MAQGLGEQRAALGRPSHLSSSPGSSLMHGQGIASLPAAAALPPHADASMHRVGAGRHAWVALHVIGAVECCAAVTGHCARGGADVAMHMSTDSIVPSPSVASIAAILPNMAGDWAQVSAWLHTPSNVNGSPSTATPGTPQSSASAQQINGGTLDSSPLESSSPPQIDSAAPEDAADAAGLPKVDDTPVQQAGKAASPTAPEPSTPHRRCQHACTRSVDDTSCLRSLSVLTIHTDRHPRAEMVSYE